MNRQLFFIILLILMACGCHGSSAFPIAIDSTMKLQQHPDWSYHASIYEVNVRQYTPEGTFKAFEKSLPRLREMGVDILWFMPITPIGQQNRKGPLGSYYSVQDYTAVNPEFGTLDDWKQLVKTAHAMGFKVIIDWVANHSSWDNVWTRTHPDFYTRDLAGHFKAPVEGWEDVIDLNYDNPALREAMISAMQFWLNETGIDGFRCDVADMVPTDFWKTAIEALKKTKPDLFMLAEAEKPEMHEAGFDATYTWSIFHTMNDVAAGKKGIPDLDAMLAHNDSIFPPGAFRMYFTVNHDENSWNGTEYEKMDGGAQTFAVLCATLPQSIPLIYSGQEAANKKRLKFFEKDSIDWENYSLQPFYKTLLQVRKVHPALSASPAATYARLKTSADASVFAFVRKNGTDEVVVILNLTAQPQQLTLTENSPHGQYQNVFDGHRLVLSAGTSLSMAPWQYWVLEKKGN